MSMYIGLDVHSKQTVVCVENEAGDVLLESSVDTTEEGLLQMLKSVKAPKATRVGLETGTQSWWVSELLLKAAMVPVVIDAAEVRAKTRRRGQKCDRRDAFEICDGLRRDQWQKIVWMPPAEVRQLRAVLSRRRHFVRIATSQVNAAKFLLRSHGFRTSRVWLTTESGWKQLLKRREMADLARYLKMHYKIWCEVSKMIGRLERQLLKAMAPFKEQVNLLCTAPGVGQITAASFLATIGDPTRFATSGHVISYLGLAPSTHDSGESERHGHITRQGCAPMRAVLVEVAQHSRRITHPLNPYYGRLMAKSGSKSAVVAVGARLARILWRMWRDNARFDLKKLNVEYKPTTRSKTYWFRIKEGSQSARA